MFGVVGGPDFRNHSIFTVLAGIEKDPGQAQVFSSPVSSDSSEVFA
jgi:hypothetical protein